MTETSSSPAKSSKKAGGTNKPTRRPATGSRSKSRHSPELLALHQWCASLNFTVRPTVHVNGPQYHACVLTVDFGTPLTQERLDQDQQNELSALMVRATVGVLGREGPIGVFNDLREGIWYSAARS